MADASAVRTRTPPINFLSFLPNRCSRSPTADASAAPGQRLPAAPDRRLPCLRCSRPPPPSCSRPPPVVARSISISRGPRATPAQQVVHADEVEPERSSALPLGRHDIRAAVVFPDPDDRRCTPGSCTALFRRRFRSASGRRRRKKCVPATSTSSRGPCRPNYAVSFDFVRRSPCAVLLLRQPARPDPEGVMTQG